MNRIDQKFNTLKEKGQKALITYVTAGDPGIAQTKKLVLEMEKRGADIIEIGIPYSDPVADGPVIERAAQRALAKGIKVKEIMQMVSEIREESEVPLLYLIYFNCILRYGVEEFIKACKEVGLDGLIIPDLPYEESGEMRKLGQQYGVHIITLIAPTSNDRIQQIAQDAKGFIYCVSSTGVTGVRKKFNTNFLDFIQEIGKHSDTPKAIGFGISTPEQVKSLKDTSDGVIVGSAIVKLIEEHGSSDELVSIVGDFVSTLKEAQV